MNDDSVSSDLPRGIGKPATAALQLAGYTKLSQLTTASESELLALHGVGQKAIRILKAALQEKGLRFAEGKGKQK